MSRKRKLRLSDSSSPGSALFDFSAASPLIYQDEPIVVQRSAAGPRQDVFPTQELPLLQTSPSRDVQLLPPRRQRVHADPLDDSVYEAFHRRMYKEERSRTLADRARMYFDMDNLKSQLALLRQHDWRRHLPAVCVVADRSDPRELAQKRQLSAIEIQKMLRKFENWERRCAAVTARVKDFEERQALKHSSAGPKKGSRNGHSNGSGRGEMSRSPEYDNGFASDDESILFTLPALIRRRLEAQRIANYGRKVTLNLRNGSQIVSDPYSYPKAYVEKAPVYHTRTRTKRGRLVARI